MRKTRSHRKRWLIGGAIGLAILAIVVGGVVWWVHDYYQRSLKPVSSSQTAVVVTIPEGSTVNQIATILEKKHLIRSAKVFTQYVRTQNQQEKLQAGTYSLRPSQSVAQIVDIMNGGDVLKKLFTILPGQRIDQIKSAMINAGFDATEVEAAFNPALYKNHPALVDKPAEASLEGYLYPDSYQKIAETKPQTIVQQSLDEMQKHLTPQMRDAFVAQGLTVHQGVTLASIVEQEVSKQAERTQAAQVFLLRQRKGMPLGSDVTAFYGSTLAGKAPSLSYDSPYNTLIHTGFPPGPISNVSDSSMQAVAFPANTDWLYFVAGDDGTTHFSHTLAEHQNLTKQYCKKLCQ
jgi:UPF0755 protein